MQGDLNLNQKGLISLGGERDVKDDAQLLQPNPELVMMPRGGGRERDDLERAVQWKCKLTFRHFELQMSAGWSNGDFY